MLVFSHFEAKERQPSLAPFTIDIMICVYI